MRLTTAVALARPTAAADRSRFVLIAAATAGAGALLLGAARITRLFAGTAGPMGTTGSDVESPAGLAPYVAESGLRVGVVLGAVLMVVPLLALGVQALRVGSLARDRRLSAFRLAGATSRQVRVVAAVEAGAAAVVGALLAGPAYVLLWVLLGALPRPGLRLLPPPDAADVGVWAALLLAFAAAGAVAGAAVQRRVVVEPLSVHRRSTPARPGAGRALAVAVGLAAVGVAVLLLNRSVSAGLELVALLAAVGGILLTALAAGPLLIRWRGLALASRGGPDRLLAGARLAADPGPPGRVAGVLIVCGVVLGVEAVYLRDLVGLVDGYGADLAFYLAGYAMVAAAVLVAAGVAVATLVVGAVDQLLDAHRPLATLVALGVEERFLLRVIRRQQVAAAVPAVVLGTLVGSALPVLQYGYGAPIGPLAAMLLPGLAAATIAGLVTAGLAALSVLFLRGRLRSAVAPDNLRAA